MISVQQAQEIVLSQVLPANLAVENISYLEAVGRILAVDVIARDPLPPFPASMKDGYAVIAADGPGLRRVLGSSVAGGSLEEPLTVHPGTCARISTGAPLPAGADAVVMVEETKLISASEDGTEELEIEIVSSVVRIGQEIRPIGSDIRQGQVVLSRGSLLSPSDIGVIATVGQVDLDVFAQPRLAVLSTGPELQESGIRLDPGRIRDCNRPTLLPLLRSAGYQTVDAGIARDDPESLRLSIQSALESADVLVTTGGVSMGEKDLLRHVLETHFSARIHFGRVDMKPGKPTTFATLPGNKKLLFALPGNPVSAVVTCHLYVIPAVKKLSGFEAVLPATSTATWKGPTAALDSRPEYHRVSLDWEHCSSDLPAAVSTGGQLSSNVLSLSRANGLAILPARTAEMETLPSGGKVKVIVIHQL